MGKALGKNCYKENGIMRVIHVVPSITQEASGPSYSVSRLCESLINEGQKISLVALDWAPMFSSPAFLKTFSIGFGPRSLGRSPAMFRWLTHEVQSNRVDLLHSHGMWQMNAVYPGWVAKKSNINLVISPRGAFSSWAMNYGSIVKKFFWPLMQLPALQHATCFHATSESEYHDIRSLGFRVPIAIIPNGIDLVKLPISQVSEQKTLLFLGRIHLVKGLDILLPAWRGVQDLFPGWRLVIAGSDEGYRGRSGYLDEIKSKAQHLGIKRVEFPGPMYGDQKFQAYRDADIYVLTSLSQRRQPVDAAAQ